ncbi:MAG: hypothetical protein MUF45_03620 [Spirosomaceae bacterium]|jgi:hypothetical protein|nr:hypothetical protein [Spirosomataceae bacterium]
MKKIFSAITLVAFSTTLTFAQSADEIITKFIAAVGGKDAIAKLNDYTMVMTGDVQGNSLEITQIRKGTDKMSQSVSVGAMGEIAKTLCDGKNVRVESQMTGTQNLEGKFLKATVAQAGTFPELLYSSNGIKMTVVGSEKINGVDSHKIELAVEDYKWFEFYEKESGLKIRQVIESPQGTATTTLTDYKEVGGIKFAHKINQDLGAFVLDLTVNKVEINKGIPDSAFEIK